MDVNEARKIVVDYWQRQKKQKAYEEQTKELKSAFNSAMKEYFETLDCSGNNIIFENEFALCSKEQQLRVSKVQRAKVIFDIEKLKKALSKPLFRKVVNKRYEINDIRGLTEYLKELDADPKIFKQFISIEETVNEECIDYLVDIGEIKESQIEGCYEVNTSEPYFTVKEVGGKDWNSIPGF